MQPPFFVIRSGQAFWVETRAPEAATATPQALADGCYSDTRWYDSAGRVWTVEEARFKTSPSFLARLLERPVVVELRFGPPADADLAEALARIAEVLQSGNEFCEAFKMSEPEMLEHFKRAHATSELAAIANRLK